MTDAVQKIFSLDAICCDIGDVLFYDFPIKLTYSYNLYAQIARHYPDAPLLWETWHCAGRKIGRLTRVASELWASANAHAWDIVLTRWDALFQPIPGALEVLKALSRFPVVLVANQPKHILPILTDLGHASLVRDIVLDTVCGVSKPDPAIYRLALDRLKSASHRCVMIGDDIDNDVVPAKQIGMQSIWIEPYPYNEDIVVPDVPAYWVELYRNERMVQIKRRLLRLAKLPSSLCADLYCPSLSHACERLQW